MKALVFALLFAGVISSAHADPLATCEFVKTGSGCSYGDIKEDGNRWIAKNCDRPCVRDGVHRGTFCVNTEGTCLPPEITNPQELLDNGQFCGPWVQVSKSDINFAQCGSFQTQWSRQWECVFIDSEFDQFKGCSDSAQNPPADH